MKVTVIPIILGALGTVPKGLERRLEELQIGGDYPDYIFVKVGQNTEKSPGDQKRLAVTQTPAKDHQLTLV